MDWTGERFIPSVGGQIEAEHLHRYGIARFLAPGKRVLDIACGEGYGSNLIAQVAQFVAGVDVADDAVAHAKLTYPATNLEYKVGSCSSIPYPDAEFDMVVSFETIEHHDQHEAMMCEIKRVLRPNGLLLISSPDKLHYSDKPNYRNPYHARELYSEEFMALLSQSFKKVKMFGQRVIYGSCIGPFQTSSSGGYWSMSGDSTAIMSAPGLSDPQYNIALASDVKLPQMRCGVFDHTQALLSAQFEGRYKKISSELQELRSRIAMLDRVNYRLGSEIDFSSTGNAMLYAREGWGAPQSDGTWTVGERASLRLALDNNSTNSELALRFAARGFSPASREYTAIRILVNGVEIGLEHHLGKQFSLTTLTLPATVIAGKLMEIEIRIENPGAPSEFGISGDTRKLGMFIQKLVVEEDDFQKEFAHGLELHQKEQWLEAISHWERMMENHQKRPEPLREKGRALMALGLMDDAETCYSELLDKYPDAPAGHIGMANLSSARHRWEEAIDRYQDVLSRFPEHREATMGLARALIKVGEVDKARNLLSDALARFSDFSAAELLLSKMNAVRKVDVINLLIKHYGLTHYLEYNKFLCELAFHEVDAQSKSVAYIPEESREEDIQDPSFARDACVLSDTYSSELILDLPALVKKYPAASFDIILFDPLHFRPEVDRAIKTLATLLKPDGFLIVHDCNPTDPKTVTKYRCKGEWCGETYKAFANFHQHNSERSITIDEDYGVGIILNRDLCLDYPDDFDLDYETFAANRPQYNGLINYETFCARLDAGNRLALML